MTEQWAEYCQECRERGIKPLGFTEWQERNGLLDE